MFPRVFVAGSPQAAACMASAMPTRRCTWVGRCSVGVRLDEGRVRDDVGHDTVGLHALQNLMRLSDNAT